MSLNKADNHYHVSDASLTKLGNLSGYSKYSPATYGSSFKEVYYKIPYYETVVREIVVPPWLAQHQELTFMNELKRRNEPPVKTYRELKLGSIPAKQHAEYEPIIYTDVVEGFGNHFNNYVLLGMVLIILLIVIKKN